MLKLQLKNATGQLTLFVNKTPQSGNRFFALLGVLEIVAIAALLFFIWSLTSEPERPLGLDSSEKNKAISSSLALSSNTQRTGTFILRIHDVGNRPIANAMVIVKGTPQIMGYTDAQGYLRPHIPANVTHITITALGYITQTFLLPNFQLFDSTPVEFQLKPNPMLVSLNALH